MSFFIVLSPAKKLSMDLSLSASIKSQPEWMQYTMELANYMKHKSSLDIQQMMHVSDKIATLNYERFQNFKGKGTIPAIMAFQGDTYVGFDVASLSLNYYHSMQQQLCILSGLYGLLRPFDLIEAYRLEMGTSLPDYPPYNLYDYWQHKIKAYWEDKVKNFSYLVNCSSQEYFKLIEPIHNHQVITPYFKILQGQKLKNPGMVIKKLRGAFARFIIEQQCSTIDDLKNFTYESYHFNDELSQPYQLFFTKKSL